MEVADQKISALVLGTVKYGDNGHVLRSFTPQTGLVAFMVHSLRSKKPGKMRPSMVLPMSSLEIVLQSRSKGNLRSMKEVHPKYHWKTLHTDPIKMTLCTFAAEVIQKSITEDQSDPEFFQKVEHWLMELDEDDTLLSTAPHHLLLIVSRHLGCYPHFETYTEGAVFDMMDGGFVKEAPNHSHWMSALESEGLLQIAEGQRPNKKIRDVVLDELLAYLRIHHEPFGTLKSLSIIRTLFG